MFSIVIMEKNLLSFIFQENACRKAYKKVFEKLKTFRGKDAGLCEKAPASAYLCNGFGFFGRLLDLADNGISCSCYDNAHQRADDVEETVWQIG